DRGRQGRPAVGGQQAVEGGQIHDPYDTGCTPHPVSLYVPPDRPSPKGSSMHPLQVAVLDEELPFPPTSGKRIRTWNLLKRMAGRPRVTGVCHRTADVAEAERAEAEFRRLGVETVVVDRRVPRKAGPGFYARLAGNLLSPLPYSVESHASRDLA